MWLQVAPFVVICHISHSDSNSSVKSELTKSLIDLRAKQRESLCLLNLFVCLFVCLDSKEPQPKSSGEIFGLISGLDTETLNIRGSNQRQFCFCETPVYRGLSLGSQQGSRLLLSCGLPSLRVLSSLRDPRWLAATSLFQPVDRKNRDRCNSSL